MEVSFIIPAYNEARTIGGCIRSILQTCRDFKGDWEIVVCDNGSTDRTHEIASSFERVRVVTETRKGANRARQCALHASSGTFIASLDADTVAPEGWLERALEELRQDSRIVAVSGPFIYHDLSQPARWLVTLYYALGYLIHLMNVIVFRRASLMQGGNVFMRRDALIKIGGYDTSIEFYGDDTALARALGKMGKVKWAFSMPIYASARRLQHEGLVRSAFVYALNHFWIILFERPHTTKYRDIRT